MLSVGRTLWNWGRSIGVRSNPFVYISNLDVADTGHVPWPAWAIELVCTTAWPDLVRMVRLGVATCQRESDLIRMGPAQREPQGLWCRPQKTKKKRKAFCVPLTPADARMLDRWPRSKSPLPPAGGRRRSSAAIPITICSRRVGCRTRKQAFGRGGTAG